MHRKSSTQHRSTSFKFESELIFVFIRFMNECTTIDTPFCLYDADRNKDTKSFKGPGVLVCSIDNMPTQLPRESTDFFGDLLFPYALDIIHSDAKKPLEEHNFTPAVEGAIIVSNGELTPNFEYIRELRALNSRSRHKAENGEAQTKKVKQRNSPFPKFGNQRNMMAKIKKLHKF